MISLQSMAAEHIVLFADNWEKNQLNRIRTDIIIIIKLIIIFIIIIIVIIITVSLLWMTSGIL